jgi:formylglycine-generating enzyme required for sulfatase activity
MDDVLFHPETSERRALILALGTYREHGFTTGEREPIERRLLGLYRDDPDSGVHGAAAWTLRQWGLQEKLAAIDSELMKLADLGERRWFVNSQWQTFAVIEGPVAFQMGSPPNEPDRDAKETLDRRTIPRRFAMAASEVSIAQYQQLMNENQGLTEVKTNQDGTDRDLPVVLSWYEAADYCNRLSRKEGLPDCYEPNSAGQYASGMKIKPDALSSGGYRLPTEAEWEYSCRAGAGTSRYYGASTELLDRYARFGDDYASGHSWPCGGLMPNELGLFDMLGNVWEWMQETYRPYDSQEILGSNDFVDALVDDKGPRLLRGGAFASPPASVRSAFRFSLPPSFRGDLIGFRPSRTYHSVPLQLYHSLRYEH